MNGLILVCMLILALWGSAEAFVPRGIASLKLPMTSTLASPRSTMLPAKKTAAVSKEDMEKYWQGDWVCSDCGYIYERDFDGGGLWFEQQKRGFICPQCSAPRKRYAKKVGDQWGVTRDGGDLPIYAGTILGLALTVYFTLVVVPSL